MNGQLATGYVLGQLVKKNDPAYWVSVYSGAISALGIILVLNAVLNHPVDIVGVATFAVLAGLAELSAVELFRSSHTRVSIASVVAIAGILAFGPWAGVLIDGSSGLMTLVTTTLMSKHPGKSRASLLQRSTFNMGMLVIAAAAAGWVYAWMGGLHENLFQRENVLPLLGVTLTDTVLNLAILIGIIRLQTGRRPLDIWNQDFKWGVPANVLAGILGGGALALAYQTIGLLGVAVFFLPILSTGYSHRLYVAHTKVNVDKLEQANQELDEANIGLLETLGAVVDAYDVYTYGHSVQVSNYAAEIAHKLNLPKADQDLITKAALVHDIGKVGVMESIISKPDKLTDDEYRIMKGHCILGAEILSRMKGLATLVPFVRHHHERWDGKGYPDGLAGEAIPLGARILALADTLDVLASDRPYRHTLTLREIREEIARCSGAQFDPQVVQAFFALLDERGTSLIKNSALTVDKSILMRGLASSNQNGRRFLKRGVVAEMQN